MSGPYSVAAKASPLGEGLGKLLLAVHGLVQGLADGTGTGDLGLEVRLILSARTVLVRSLPKMDALDRMPSSWSVTVSGLPNSMPESLACSSSFSGSALTQRRCRCRRWPAGNAANRRWQRNADQAVQVAAFSNIALDGLAKADADLLGSVGSDALRHVGHEGVGQTLLDDLVDEGLGSRIFGSTTTGRPST